MKRVAVFSVLALVLGGCSTAIHGTAPARPGFVYAVGSRNALPAAWLCPAAAQGECQRIKMQIEDD